MSRNWALRIGLGIGICCLIAAHGWAQMERGRTVNAEQKSAIIDSVTSVISEHYIFPDVAKKMSEHVHKLNRGGAYTTISELREFAEKLTDDLRSVSNDRHLWVGVIPPERKATLLADSATQAEDRRKQQVEAARDNYGFEKVERLSGNIGYLKFDRFHGAEEAGATAIAAMNFVGNCDALIFDLRENGGGDPSMIQLITSYLYETPQHLNSFQVRGQEKLDQFWTHAYVPGKRMASVPVYVLTSEHTFSGAEEFSYNLKSMKRGTIVGEVTGGGAHPTDLHRILSLDVVVSVPYGRAINPITNTNWEGTGVQPDIECPAPEAFNRARLDALTKLRERESDPDRGREMEWKIEALTAQVHPVQLTAEQLAPLAGVYGPRTVSVVNGALLYARDNGPKRVLIPITPNRFMLEDIEYFRLEFVADQTGKVKEVVGHYDNGTTDRNERTN